MYSMDALVDMNDIALKVHILYQRPMVPVFLLITDDGRRLDIKENSLYIAPDLYPLYVDNKERLERMKNPIEFKEIFEEPDISFATQIPLDAVFSIYSHVHQMISAKLVAWFTELMNNAVEEFPKYIAYIKDRIHPKLFYYALSVSLSHSEREELRAIRGDVVNAFPLNFFQIKVLEEATKKRITMDDLRKRPPNLKPSSPRPKPIPPPVETYLDDDYHDRFMVLMTDDDGEVAYFREDIALNSYYSHWHVAYPYEGLHMDKHRRGEYFFYTNQQMIARYNNERLCTKLTRVMPFTSYRREIREGYYPNLRHIGNKTNWPGRPSNLAWRNVFRPLDHAVASVSDVMAIRGKIEEAITQGNVIIDNQYYEKLMKKKESEDNANANVAASSSNTFFVPKPEDKKPNTPDKKPDAQGIFKLRHKVLDIDLLGHIIEATELTPNIDLYGGFTNAGHVFTSFIHDPTRMFAQPMGIMGDSSVATRDPMFFRWHAAIDELFQKFKMSKHVSAYEESDLLFDEIKIKSVGLVDENSEDMESKFVTFWTNTIVKVQDLDYRKMKYIPVEFKHLDHKPFSYKIVVENRSGFPLNGTVRIFMGPRLNENKIPLDINQERRLFVELDKFVKTFKPGLNVIIQHSADSSVTTPMDQLFPETFNKTKGNYCNCRWPHHLLIPKGSVEGAKYHLFIMISNENIDKDMEFKNNLGNVSVDFCGIRDKKYPDPRPMGFPLDRPFVLARDRRYVEEIVNLYPNMIVHDIDIVHNDTILLNPSNDMVLRS